MISKLHRLQKFSFTIKSRKSNWLQLMLDCDNILLNKMIAFLTKLTKRQVACNNKKN